jgi:hypothetical protein
MWQRRSVTKVPGVHKLTSSKQKGEQYESVDRESLFIGCGL